MSQMCIADQAVIKAIPGNDKCVNCGIKNPQWACVSFGILFCLDCSGQHRSLGVHISFVRSVAMDSWTIQQLEIMKAGGNNACNTFLLEKGNIASSTPIRQKYDNPTATYYKDVLRAKIEGKPTPPMPTVSTNATKSSSSSSTNDLLGKKKEEDPNGRERLTGETEEQYIARQTRLRDEARARLAAKGFGGSKSMSSSSSSSSSGPSRGYMQGIGSDASYDPSRGGYGNNTSSIVDISQVKGTITSGLGSAWSSIGSVANSVLKDDNNIVGSLSGTVYSTGAGLWSSFSSAAQSVAKNLTAPDMGGMDDSTTDALKELQEMARVSKTNKYAGFGSEHFQNTTSNMTHSSSSSFSSSHGLKNNDVSKSLNQMEQLDGESNEQYMEGPIPQYDKTSMTMTLTKDKGSSESFHSTVSNTAPSAAKSSATRMKLDTTDDFFSSFGA